MTFVAVLHSLPASQHQQQHLKKIQRRLTYLTRPVKWVMAKWGSEAACGGPVRLLLPLLWEYGPTSISPRAPPKAGPLGMGFWVPKSPKPWGLRGAPKLGGLGGGSPQTRGA